MLNCIKCINMKKMGDCYKTYLGVLQRSFLDLSENAQSVVVPFLVGKE